MLGGRGTPTVGRGDAVTFTAMHTGRGRFDATQDDLRCGWAWTEVHRARPRQPPTHRSMG